MGKTTIIPTIVFILFCCSMIIFYIVGLIFPEQTNYWLVRDGLPIIFLEFFSIIAFVFMPAKQNMNSAPLVHQPSGDLNTMQQPNRPTTLVLLPQEISSDLGEHTIVNIFRMISSWAIFLLILFMAFTFTYFLDIWLFLYFLVALAIKYYFFQKASTEEKSKEWMKSAVIPTISILLSVLVARYLKDFILPSFSRQIEILNLYFKSQAPTWIHFKGIEFDNPGYTALWGIVYFVLLLVLTLIAIRVQKKGDSLGSYRYVKIYK